MKSKCVLAIKMLSLLHNWFGSGNFVTLGGFVGKLLGAIICVTLLVCSASAVELSFMDFDRTIFKPEKFDRNTPGTYGSKVILYRIENRPNFFVEFNDAPVEIEVSAVDLEHRLTKMNDITKKDELLLAARDGRFGSLDKVTLSDGRVIVPGIYYLNVPASFKYYRESPAGRNYLLEDFKNAEELEARKIGTFKGPYWNHMVNLLSHVDSAKQFGIITARGHSKREWQEFFDYLLTKGYIKFLPDMRHIHNINRPEYEKYGMGDSDSLRKVGLLKQIIMDMSIRKFRDSDYRLHPNGSEAASIHSISFADDNQRTLELAYEELRSLAMRRTPVKIIISSAALDHEVNQSRKPRSYVITDRGLIRPATNFETYGEPVHQNANRFQGAKNSAELERGLIKTCASLF